MHIKLFIPDQLAKSGIVKIGYWFLVQIKFMKVYYLLQQ